MSYRCRARAIGAVHEPSVPCTSDRAIATRQNFFRSTPPPVSVDAGSMKPGVLIASALSMGIGVGLTLRPSHRSKRASPTVEVQTKVTTAPTAPPVMVEPEKNESEPIAAAADSEPSSEPATEPPAEPAPVIADTEDVHSAPPPPRDPEVRGQLIEKYRSATSEELKLARESLTEVYEEQLRRSTIGHGVVVNRAHLKALSDELGYLAERGAR
jgi:hypothetical protein